MSYSIILGDYEPKDAFDIEIGVGVNKLRIARFTLPNSKNKYSGVEETDWMQVSLDSKLLFDGVVDNVEDILRGGDFLGIEGVGKGVALFNMLITKDYDNINGRTIIKEVASLVGLDVSLVDPDNEIASTFTKKYEKVSAFNIIEEICRESAKATGEVGFYFYVNTEGTKLIVYPYDKFTSSVVAERGVNLASYRRKKLGRTIKNKIWVKGEASKPLPLDKDAWTESLLRWTSNGTLSRDATIKKVGSYSIKSTIEVSASLTMQHSFPSPVSCIQTGPRKLRFWIRQSSNQNPLHIIYYLYAPDFDNCFVKQIYTDKMLDQWIRKEFEVGEASDWGRVGNANWENISELKIVFVVEGQGTISAWIDELHFWGKRWEGFAEDSSSQTKHGVREKYFVDDRLLTDEDCLLTAKRLLATLKDSSKVIEVEISPANYDLIQGHKLRIVDATKNIDEYARILEVTQHLGEEKKTTLELSKEPIGWTPLFLDTSRKLELLSKGLEKK